MTIIATLQWIIHNFLFIISGILGICFLIGFHELGHFLFCKIFGITTPSFSIGFGPKIFKKMIGSTEFSVSAIPLGGYVEIAGVAEVGQGEQKHAHDMGHGSFIRKPFYQKLLVLLGGIIFNLLFAYAAFIILFSMGISDSQHYFPLNATPTIVHVAPELPAEKAGILPGDTITKINNNTIKTGVMELLLLIRNRNNDTVIVSVERDGKSKDIPVTLMTNNILGVQFQHKPISACSMKDALIQGITATNFFIYQTILGFKQLLATRNIKQMAGPIAIISMTSKSIGIGMNFFLFLLAIISINLAIFNLLPLPILDGGQIVFYAIEAAIGRPLSLKLKEYIHIACWIFFLLLTLYLSAHDIIRLIQAHFAQ